MPAAPAPPAPSAGPAGSWAASWRLGAVALLAFSSGMPLGLVWSAIPTWMALLGFDIKVVGLFTLAQAPWSLKPLWSPLMDRYAPPGLGRKRGWVLLSQVTLTLLGLALAAAARPPVEAWVVGLLALAIAFASATQDIAYDGYVVELLEPAEHGTAVGARTAFARAGMFVTQRLSITASALMSWPTVHALLALLYLPFTLVTRWAPEPALVPAAPHSLREAVWGPFLGLLRQHRALEILAFVVLYKLSDNLTQALTGPFLVQMKYSEFDIGVASGVVGLAAILAGTYTGAKLTDRLGLGRALWIFGGLQIVSNLGYALVAQLGPGPDPGKRLAMYAAQAFEMGSSGLGTGAFGVLLLRLTQKRFSATQYALLSSLFALPRIVAGPPVGLLADAIGWRDFFVATLATGVPGMYMLARFVPWHAREVVFEVAAPSVRARLGRGALLARAASWAAVTWLAVLGLLAALAGAKSLRSGRAFDFAGHAWALAIPATVETGLSALGALLCGLFAGLTVAATLVARHEGVAAALSAAGPPERA